LCSRFLRPPGQQRIAGERVEMPDVDQMYAEAERLKDQGNFPQAIEKLQELLGHDPDHVLSHLALAVLYGRVGQHELAIEHGQRACELDPKDPFHFTALSVTYQRAWQGTHHQPYIQMAENAMAQAHALQGRM
jgi:Flp pilus assembly protein TadD